MKWKPDEWVCVIRVKRELLLTACDVSISALCIKLYFTGSTYIWVLPGRCFPDMKCLALLPNMMRCRKTRPPSSVATETSSWACFASTVPLSPKSLSLCEPVASAGRESWPLFPLALLIPVLHLPSSVYLMSWGAVYSLESPILLSLLF